MNWSRISELPNLPISCLFVNSPPQTLPGNSYEPSLNDQTLSFDSDKASALSLHFSRCFNYSVPPLSATCNIPFSASSDLICSPEDIYNIIKSWNTKLSSGPDNIPITLLKPVAHSISIPLSLNSFVFNSSQLEIGQDHSYSQIKGC